MSPQHLRQKHKIQEFKVILQLPMKPCLKSKTKSKLRIMAPTCNKEFKASLALHCEFQASKGYCINTCIKKQKNPKQNKTQTFPASQKRKNKMVIAKFSKSATLLQEKPQQLQYTRPCHVPGRMPGPIHKSSQLCTIPRGECSTHFLEEKLRYELPA